MLFLVLLIAISLFCIAVTAETEAFSGNILSGESIDMDEFTFIITMNKYASAIFVDGGDIFQTVQLYDCEKMKSFRICFDNTTYDEEDNELYAVVRINRSKPVVEVTKTINQTELYVGQEAEVTLTITNTGDTAPQIELVDDYPTSIKIYDIEGGCSIHENQVYWKGHLDEQSEKECKFIIMGTKELHQSFVAELKYWDHFKWETEYSTKLTLDIEPVLSVQTSVIREDFEIDGTTFDYDDENPSIYIGEVLRFMVNITNEYDDHIEVNAFDINLPPDLKYSSIGHLRFNYINASGNRSSLLWNSDRITKVSENTLRWTGRISEGNSKLFIVKLIARRSGDQNIVVRTDFEYDDLDFTTTEHDTFTVFDPGLSIRMTVEDKRKRFSAPERLDEEEDEIELESLHPYHFRVFAQNINKYSKLEDVKVKVITEFAVFPDVRYSEILGEGSKIPYSVEVIPPQIESAETFEMNVSITYKNAYGEFHENSTEFVIQLKAFKDIVIDLESSEGEVLEGGEETEITVSLDNQRLVDIKSVSVKDIIPSEFHVEGVHAKKLKLNKDEDTEVYTYRIIPPIVKNETKYNITTVVSYLDPDRNVPFNISEITEFTVKPLKPDITAEASYEEPDDIYPGTLIPVEYTIRNDEEEQVVRDINVFFPIQKEFSMIGPKTFFIEKLDPGEEIILKDMIKLRPKIAGESIELNKTVVEYKDNYGNLFLENISSETFDVEEALISGPAIWLSTIVPGVINKSTESRIRIALVNNGSGSGDVFVEQDDKIWNITVGAGKTEYIDYMVKYDHEGNYSLGDPVAKVKYQGLEGYTRGDGAEVQVKLLLGPEIEALEEVVQEVVPEAIEPEKEEMSFEQYDFIQEVEFRKKVTRFALMAVIVVVVMILIVAYIAYERRKGPSHPFIDVSKPPGEEEVK